MPSFEDIGLREELLRTLEEEEIDHPTALQEAVIPTLRRGGNLVARASTGAGKTLAYGLGVLDRLRPQELEAEDHPTPLRFLVLVPTRGSAERAALALAPYAQATGLGISVAGGAWGTRIDGAELLLGTPDDVMGSVRSSALKLDEVEAVVVDDASSIVTIGGWESVDAIIDLIPRDAQRVVISGALPDEVEDLVERRVKRAIRYPVEPAIPGEQPATPIQGQIGYVVVSEKQKLEVLARQLSAPEEGGIPPILFLGSDERAALLAEQLAIRGFLVGAIDDEEADVAVVSSETTRTDLLEESPAGIGQTISFEVPPDAATLLARHSGDDGAVVLLEPRELTHLREIARQAGVRANPLPLPIEDGTAGELAAFRESLRRAVREEDLGAHLLLLEPLLEQYPAHELAAAAVALLRRKTPPPAPQVATAAAPSVASPAASPTGAPATAPSRGVDAGPPPATWARLYVGVGSRDQIRPADLVGAITGEASIRGNQVGKIDIRENFSIVEIEAPVADKVISSVNGTTLRGRSVRVDYDRGTDRGRKAPGAGPSGRGGPGGRSGPGGRGAPAGRGGVPRRTDRRPPKRD